MDMFKRKKTYTFFCFFPQMVQKTSHHLFFQKEGKPRKLILLIYIVALFASHLSSFVCSFQHRPPFHHHFRVLHMCWNFQHKQRPCRRHQDLVTNIMDLSEAPEEAKVGKDMNSRDARFEKKMPNHSLHVFSGSWYKFSFWEIILLTGIVVV